MDRFNMAGLSKEARNYLAARGFPADLLPKLEAPLHNASWDELQETKKHASRAIDAMLRDATPPAGLTAEARADAEELMLSVSGAVSRELEKRDEAGDRGPRNLKSGRHVTGGDRQAPKSGIWFRNTENGEIIRAAAGSERLADACPRVARANGGFGDLVASLYRGGPISPELAEDYRTMSIGSVTAGGYAVPAPYSLRFLDYARAEMVCMKAGASTIPMEGNTLQLARIDGDVTAAWKSENNAFTPSDATLGRLLLTARTIGVLVKLSEELMMDSPNIGQILEASIVGAMSRKMDAAGLVGSGVAPEPQGIYGGTNVQTVTVGGAPGSYAFFSQMVQKVRNANHEPNSAIWNPRDLGTLDRLVDTTGQPLQPPESFKGVKHFSTTAIPTTYENGASPNDGSIAIVGKFDELVFAPRLGITLLFSRESNDGTDSATAKYQIHIRAVARMDVGLARGAAFCVGTSIND